MKRASITCVQAFPTLCRRRFLATLGACAMSGPVSLSAQVLSSATDALTKVERDRLTPKQVIDELKRGNERFRSGTNASRDYRDQQRSTAAGQYPAAVALGCVDSRAPAEIIFDLGIGDMFSARIAGNVVNDDLLGSLEFALCRGRCKSDRALWIYGMRRGEGRDRRCGEEMGNLTGLLARIKPAISATKFTGEKSSKNVKYVDAVARTNVLLGLDGIRRRSPILADLEKKGTIQIVGGMYDLATGSLEFLSEPKSERG